MMTMNGEEMGSSKLKLITLLLAFCGCDHDNLQKPENMKRITEEIVLLSMVGNSQRKPIEYTTIYSNGRYCYRIFQKSKNPWKESSGFVPESIFSKIKQRGLKSNLITNLDGANIYNYDIANSVIKHPPGIGELLGCISKGN